MKTFTEKLTPLKGTPARSLLPVKPISSNSDIDKILDSLNLSDSNQKKLLMEFAEIIHLYERTALLPHNLNVLQESIRSLSELSESITKLNNSYNSLDKNALGRLFKSLRKPHQIQFGRDTYKIAESIGNLTCLIEPFSRDGMTATPIDITILELKNHLSQLSDRKMKFEEGLRSCAIQLIEVCKKYELKITKDHRTTSDKVSGHKEFIDPIWSLIQKVFEVTGHADFEITKRQLRRAVEQVS